MNKREYTLRNRASIIDFLRYTSIPDKDCIEIITISNLENKQNLLKIVRYNKNVIKIDVIDHYKVTTSFEDYKEFQLIMCDSCSKIEEKIENVCINCRCDSQSREPRELTLYLEQDIDNVDTDDVMYYIDLSIKNLQITHRYYQS